MSRSTTKPTKWPVRPAKTQISMGIRPVWSASSLCARRSLRSLAILKAHSQGWSESSLGAIAILLVLLCCGSYSVCGMRSLAWFFTVCLCHKYIFHADLTWSKIEPPKHIYKKTSFFAVHTWFYFRVLVVFSFLNSLTFLKFNYRNLKIYNFIYRRLSKKKKKTEKKKKKIRHFLRLSKRNVHGCIAVH